MSDNRVIPEAAVEAAAREYVGPGDTAWDDLTPMVRGMRIHKMQKALEAAAPHMLAGAWESGWTNARGNYTALYAGRDIPEWVTLRNPYGSSRG